MSLYFANILDLGYLVTFLMNQQQTDVNKYITSLI